MPDFTVHVYHQRTHIAGVPRLGSIKKNKETVKATDAEAAIAQAYGAELLRYPRSNFRVYVETQNDLGTHGIGAVEMADAIERT